jgi:hypothetical protein
MGSAAHDLLVVKTLTALAGIAAMRSVKIHDSLWVLVTGFSLG